MSNQNMAYSRGQHYINYAVALISIHMHDYKDSVGMEKISHLDSIRDELEKVQRIMQDLDYWMLCSHEKQKRLVDLVTDVSTFLAHAGV